MADFLEDARGVKDAHEKFFKMVFSNEFGYKNFYRQVLSKRY
ncbi:MAG: hypothetical protein ACP5OE_04730 [Thermodesulfobium sp.]